MGLRRQRSRSYGVALLAAAAALTGAGLVGTGAGPAARAEDPAVLFAVGDVATCDNDFDVATSGLVDSDPHAPIAMVGDLTNGFAPDEYPCFVESWGRHKARIHPVVGDQERVGEHLGFGTMADFRRYWGDQAPPVNGGYSWDVVLPGGATWHVVALDSTCGDDSDPEYPNPCSRADEAAQLKWLEADLAAHPSVCTVAYWHHIYWDTKPKEPGGDTEEDVASIPGHLRPLYKVLYQNGVDVILNGHRHTYRRHAPMDPEGRADPDFGIRQFTVGTGGHTQKEDKEISALLEAALPADSADPAVFEPTYGVLRLELSSAGYAWEFKRAAGREYTDSGTATCHGAPGGPVPTTVTTVPAPPSPAPPPEAPPPAARSGYWMLAVDGRVWAFGDAAHHGEHTARFFGSDAADIESTPSGRGYWVVDQSGRVHTFGDAPGLGSVPARGLNAGEVATSLSATPTGRGYWIFTSRGRAIAFGDAERLGDMSAVALNGPVLDSMPTPSGRGYYMVASDGGIFAFGDARFAGSMGGQLLNAPVQSLVPDPDGAGYWLVASDGGVFAFGAGFRGSMGATPLNRPVTGMVPFGNGYLMVAEDGGIFNFSDEPFAGSLAGSPPSRPVTAVAALPR